MEQSRQANAGQDRQRTQYRHESFRLGKHQYKAPLEIVIGRSQQLGSLSLSQYIEQRIAWLTGVRLQRFVEQLIVQLAIIDETRVAPCIVNQDTKVAPAGQLQCAFKIYASSLRMPPSAAGRRVLSTPR